VHRRGAGDADRGEVLALARKVWSRAADRYAIWKARDDYVRYLENAPVLAAFTALEAAAARARRHYHLAAARRKRDKLKVPRPWGSWQELEAELRGNGQI
jgi:hypothetical protein